jgi:5'-phosphate synthase pdxT subunit
VQRNAFGSQVDSFETELTVAGFDEPVSATFIRAPRVVETGPAVEVLASLPDGAIVAVRQGALSAPRSTPRCRGRRGSTSCSSISSPHARAERMPRPASTDA